MMTAYEMIQALVKVPADTQIKFRALIQDDYELDNEAVTIDFNHEVKVATIIPQDNNLLVWLKYEGDE